MGSCLSTNSAAPPPNTPNSAHHDGGSKSPPLVYEETVKEVLSETPAVPKHRLLPIPRFHEKERMLHKNGGAAKNPAAAFGGGRGDPSDNYEIHSASTLSTKNDGGLRRPRRDGRSFYGEVKREKTAAGSSARRSDSYLGRVKPGSRSVRNTCGGERYGRMSRSPVSRSDSGSSKTGLDTSKSFMKTGNYPGRVEYGSGDRIRKGKEEEREPPTNIELLESSVVSLECFIFL